MELLTPELRQAIPPLGSTDSHPDPMVHAKFFHPVFAWHVIEASATTRPLMSIARRDGGGRATTATN